MAIQTSGTRTTSKTTNRHNFASHASKNRIKVRVLTKKERKMIAGQIFDSENSKIKLPKGINVNHTYPSQGYICVSLDTSRPPDLSVRISYSVPLHPGDTVATAAHDRTTQSKNTGHVEFNETVAVLEIPSHRNYDRKTRQSMFNSIKQIRANASRNRREWNSDGRDWRKCKEEGDMVLLKGGELMHPATYRSIQRENQRAVLLENLRDEDQEEEEEEEEEEEGDDPQDESVPNTGTCGNLYAGPTGAIRSLADHYLYRPIGFRNTTALSMTSHNHPKMRVLPRHFLQQGPSLLSSSAKIVPTKVQRRRKCTALHKRTLFRPAGKRPTMLSH